MPYLPFHHRGSESRRDEYHLHHGARILSARLTAHGVAHEHREFDDDHRSLSYRYRESLPPLARALGA